MDGSSGIFYTSTGPTACPGEQVSFENNSWGNMLTYLWLFGDGDSSTIEEPSHTFVDTYNFTYVVMGSGPCANDSATVSVTVSICTGIPEISSSVWVKIYPNPNKGQFTVELTNAKKEDYLIEVRNIIT